MGGRRLEKLEEIQWSTEGQKDASETVISNVTWGRNVGYNEATINTGWR